MTDVQRSTEETIERLVALASEFLPDDNIESPEERLAVIGTESIRAIEFVMAVEEEFDLEIEDDDLGPEFFIAYEHIAKAIQKASV